MAGGKVKWQEGTFMVVSEEKDELKVNELRIWYGEPRRTYSTFRITGINYSVVYYQYVGSGMSSSWSIEFILENSVLVSDLFVGEL